nr:MAG TPA: hypothetical protein [Caudoviricetes sp.]
MKVGMAKIIKQLKAVKRKEGLTLSLSLISFLLADFCFSKNTINRLILVD